MRINIKVTQLEAAALVSLLADAMQITKVTGDEARHGVYARLASSLADAIKSSRTNLSEAELL